MRKCDKCGGKGYILVDDFISLPNMLKPVICPSCSDNIEEVKQTNADKIRSMNDEELAKLLTRITNDAQLNVGAKCNYQWDEWLQSEVSDGN